MHSIHTILHYAPVAIVVVIAIMALVLHATARR